MNKESLFKIAKRENNTIRPYLLVNPIQGKHIPVSPSMAIALFLELGKKIYQKHEAEHLLFIGFAETATAIGAAIASFYPQDVYYIHTTREHSKHWECLYFSETHSHATEQKLAVQSIEKMIHKIDRIVFIEDEVTTGNTILNIIEVIQKRWSHLPIQYGIASLLNGMTDEALENFEKKQIPVTFLERVNKQDYTQYLKQFQYKSSTALQQTTSDAVFSRAILRQNADPRTGVWAKAYLQQCKNLATAILHQIGQSISSDSISSDSISSDSISSDSISSDKKILVLGSEEFMFAPMYFAKTLEEHFPQATVRFHAQTRSPILPSSGEGYPLFARYELNSLYEDSRKTFLYNLQSYDHVILIHDAQNPNPKGIADLNAALKTAGCKHFYIYKWQNAMTSSYPNADVTLLLKDITGLVTPLPTEERERKIQNGAHYSTMLPLEYSPTAKYMEAYDSALHNYAQATADAVCQLAEQLYKVKGENLTIVSLARAGIPVGILVKQYLKMKYQFTPTHYAVSIIRGRGIDKNAMEYILENHDANSIQFVDGWIGKGAILRQLKEALEIFPKVNPSLGVLSDPANLTALCGTHEDILIPSSCLNSTVSGLLSRTFLNDDIIKKYDFHGACYYQELQDEDLSNDFIHTIVKHFDLQTTPKILLAGQSGMVEAEKIAKHFGISDINLVKPGIGEATRVLLRRKPWKLLVWENGENDPNLAHLIRLAYEKHVPITTYPLQNYKACGIIQNLADT